jgi:adenine phosphoribosyltransferase
VVDGEALEMPCTAMYRGFESHLFLQPRPRRGFLFNIYFIIIYTLFGVKMYKHLINEVNDFPKEGVSFKDISPLLKSSAFPEVIKDLGSMFTNLDKVDYFIGIDSRGFIFAAALSTLFNKGLILMRKKGKLPPPVVSKSYSLEYGEDSLELSPGNGNVIIIDDVLATGGTLKTAIQLCNKAGYNVVDVGVLIDLLFLHDSDINVKSLIKYE